MDVGGILIGTNVDIQRTDGRVHSAIISGINGESRSCTVEWYEKGEAKGKEIEFEAIYQLNPALMPRDGDTHSANNHAAPPPPAPVSTAASSRQVNNGPSTSAAPTPAQPVNSRIPGAARRNPNIQTGGRQVSNSSAATAATVEEPAAIPAPRVNVAALQQQQAAAAKLEQQQQQQAAEAAPSGGGRKSNTVKEIERIQAQREERRAAQRAAREQPEYDPSNPQYQFLLMIREYQATLDYRPLTNADVIENHQICVCVRKRPLNKKEMNRKEIDVTTIPNKEHVIIHEPKLKVDLTKYLENQKFRFDYAFDLEADNALVYRYTAQPLVESIFEAGMATCFAYGQTGSGKTHTMGGDFTSKGQQDCAKGIYALAARDVFRLLKTKYRTEGLFCEAAFFEIYSGKVFDLLNKKAKLRVLEDGKAVVNVVGLKMEKVTSVDDVLRLLQMGHAARTSGQTSANLHSSRSHAVFQLILRRSNTRKLHGKFSLIDLAGNERGADTNSADRITRMEGAEINKSLLALKECIRALGRKGAHLPFRASKLTQVLRDSFIGSKARTCMIATISPGMSCCEHTLNTLRYADRVKELGVDDVNSARSGQGNGNAKADPLQDVSLLEDEELPHDFLLDDQDSEDRDPLALLRSVRGGALDEEEDEETTQEYLTFHEVVNHIEEMEEDINDSHRVLCDDTADWVTDMRQLCMMSDQVDYDVDDYSKRLLDMLEKQTAALGQLKEKVVNWRSELRQEEELSTRMQARRAAAKATKSSAPAAATGRKR